MRVLFVSHSLPPAGRPLDNVGGMQRSAAELYEALGSRHDVELVPLVLRSAWSQRHWRVPAFLLRALPYIARVAARREVDVVLFSSMVTGALVVPLRRRLARAAIPSAIIVHGLDVTLPLALHQRMVRRVFRSADLVLPVSRATARACIARDMAAERTVVIHPGIDVRRFDAPADRARARRELIAVLGDPAHPPPEDALLLCSVGRQVERKGFRWFVAEVMPGLGPHVHYWLAGHGPEHQRLRAAIVHRGLGGRVRLLGGVSEEELSLLYRGADLLVMPNVAVRGDMEGFGLVALEAGACGMPVVASRLEGIIDAVTEGENGHLVTSGDAGAFLATIERHRLDRGGLRALGARAARHVVASFDWPVAADRYIAVLRSRVAGQSASNRHDEASVRR